MAWPLVAMAALGAAGGAMGGKQKAKRSQQPTTTTIDMHNRRDPYNPMNVSPGAQQYLGGQGGSGNQILDFLLSSGVGMLGGGMERTKQRQPQWDDIMSGIMGGYQDKYGG